MQADHGESLIAKTYRNPELVLGLGASTVNWWSRHSPHHHGTGTQWHWTTTKKFLWDAGIPLKWPFPVETVREYVKWAIKLKGLGADTIKVYLSDFKLAHKLRELRFDSHNDFSLAPCWKEPRTCICTETFSSLHVSWCLFNYWKYWVTR